MATSSRMGRNVARRDRRPRRRRSGRCTASSTARASRWTRATRSSAASASPSGIPIRRPIVTEVDGMVGYEDLVEGASITETVDESTGITKRVVIDWRTSTRSADLRPAIVIDGRSGKIAKLARGGDARYLLPVDAIIAADPGIEGEGRRRAGPYLDGERQDPRHHGRSAARGGAVRGASSEGGGDHRREVRHDPVRPRLQEQASDHADAGRRLRSRSST